MIGKPEWFGIRKFGGWGVRPKTWQGWAYIFVFIIIVTGITFIPGLNEITQTYIVLGLTGLFVADIAHVMIKMKRDERELIHEAISDRNAIWFMLLILVIGLMYESIKAGLNNEVYINPFIISALIGAAIVKTVTIYYLDKKN